MRFGLDGADPSAIIDTIRGAFIAG